MGSFHNTTILEKYLKSVFCAAGTIIWVNFMPAMVKNDLSLSAPLVVRVLNECIKRMLL
jgi:hypothetical protein